MGPQKRTTVLMNNILNSMVEYLKFTTEDCEEFESRTLPTLDCQLWIENNEILHTFYEKPQVGNRVLLHNTALASTSLNSSIIQEGVRRLLNTSENVSDKVRTGILDKFASKIINSGYSVKDAKMFLVHAVTSYTHKVLLSELPSDHTNFKPLYYSRDYKREERAINKARAKTNWFRNKGSDGLQSDSWKTLLPREWRNRTLRQRNIDGIEVTTVMTVPNTLDSILLNSLVLKEAQLSRVTGYSIKLVEGNGMPLSKLFPTPLSLDVCDRTDECSVCRLSCGASRCTI